MFAPHALVNTPDAHIKSDPRAKQESSRIRLFWPARRTSRNGGELCKRFSTWLEQRGPKTQTAAGKAERRLILLILP